MKNYEKKVNGILKKVDLMKEEINKYIEELNQELEQNIKAINKIQEQSEVIEARLFKVIKIRNKLFSVTNWWIGTIGSKEISDNERD